MRKLFGIAATVVVFAGTAQAATMSSYTTKATPTTSDTLLISDVAAANATKKVTIGSLPPWAGVTPATGIAAWIATPSGANLATALTSALPASKGGTGLTALGTGVATALGNTTNSTGGLMVLPTGFSVDDDGDVTAKSVTVTRTTSPTVIRFYEGTGGGDNYKDLTLSGNLAGDTTAHLDTIESNAALNVAAGTGPTVDAAGEHSTDTTSDQFIYYGGAKRVLSYKGYEPFVIKSPVDSDDFLIGPFPYAITLTNINLVAQGGGSIVITPQICASDTTTCSSLEAITADGGVDTDDGSLSYSAVASGGFIKILSAAPTGTVNFLSGSVYFTITAD